MNQQGVLALARQGDAKAIARLIQQALITRGIEVKAIRNASRLLVLLESAQVPDQRMYTRVVYAAVLCLGATTIKTLHVYGRQTGQPVPAWTWNYVLRYPSLSQEKGPVAQPVVAQSVSINGQSAALHETAPLPRVAAGKPFAKTAAKKRSRLAPSPVSPRSRPAPPATIPFDRRLMSSFVVLVCASFGLGAGLNLLLQTQPKSLVGDGSSVKDEPAKANPTNPSPVAQATQTAMLAKAPFKSPNPAEVAVTLKAVGDIIPGTNYPSDRLPPDDGQSLFSNVKPFLGDADIVFGNFESTLTDYPYAAKDMSQGMTFAFRTPPHYTQWLKDAGFNILSVANNHSFDFAEQGFEDTIANIEQAGIKAVGKKGQIVYLDVRKTRVAFIGFSYLDDHNSMNDLATAKALVDEAKKQAQIVVISVHAGAEGSDADRTKDETEYFFGENRGNSVNFAHTLIDQGADLVLGHGPHIPRALELYRGKLVAYSLGNFMGYRTLSSDGKLGNSLILQAQLNANGDFVSGRVIPVALDADGVPHLDDYFQSVVLIRNLIEGDFPVTPLLIDDMGYILKNEAPLK